MPLDDDELEAALGKIGIAGEGEEADGKIGKIGTGIADADTLGEGVGDFKELDELDEDELELDGATDAALELADDGEAGGKNGIIGETEEETDGPALGDTPGLLAAGDEGAALLLVGLAGLTEDDGPALGETGLLAKVLGELTEGETEDTPDEDTDGNAFGIVQHAAQTT